MWALKNDISFLGSRLEFLDVNECTEPEPLYTDYEMTTPDSACYKDLHEGMKDEFSGLSSEKIDNFLWQFEKKIEMDKWSLMHKERYIRNIRLAKQGDGIFIKGRVWAEMSKNTSYALDIKLDSYFVPEELQCQCSAGAGPTAHCKHVCVVLYALNDFSKGIPIITDTTCTQRLQTFHHSKPHKGTPMKSETLIEFRKRSTNPVFDPRPRKYRKRDECQDRFQNICINFQANNPSREMPVMQLIKPANMRCVYNDHDYMEHHIEDYFLDKILNLTSISQEEIARIEECTRKQQKSTSWHDERSYRITSSNFGTICRATEKRDLGKLLSDLMDKKDLNTAPIRHGKNMNLSRSRSLKKNKNVQ